MKFTKRFLSVLLALALCLCLLPTAAFADESTTTYNTAYKDISANTEIYAVSDTASASYPYYGALYEPESGCYYGRVAGGGVTASGGWGLTNGSNLANESAFSYYYSLTDSYSLQYWSYIYGNLLDGSKLFLVNLNFENEGADCDLVVSGYYDSKLTETFNYLATLDCPILLRIGGEVNTWTDRPSASTYISAYRYVANLAHQLCPNVALVFNVSASSSYLLDMDSYYPGDAYVDWVGVSLYYNHYANNGDTARDAFYGVNEYGDALLNVQQTVNLSNLHNKPIIVTEGGSAWYQVGKDVSDFASDRVERAMAYLSMVYPQIKCIIYSDVNFGSTTTKYQIFDNATMEAAFDSGVATNPTLLHDCRDTASYYTPFSEYDTVGKTSITLAAYTYSSYSAGRLTAEWYIDGVLQSTTSSYPYQYTISCSSLSDGNHTVTVKFSNGESKSYTFYNTADPCANGHTWGAGVITTPATATEDGVITYTCKYCGETKTEVIPAEGIDPFTDVNTGHYFYNAVLWAVDNGITSGTTETTFSPFLTAERCQVVTFLWRAAGCPEVAEGTENPFTDVSESDYFYTAVLWAVEQGITTGTSATTFSPYTTCERCQVVTFLYRYFGEPEITTTENPFTDVNTGNYFYNAVLWAVDNGITSGTTATTFGPFVTCERCMVVTFLYRALGE